MAKAKKEEVAVEESVAVEPSEESIHAQHLASAKKKLAEGLSVPQLSLVEQIALVRDEQGK